MRVINFFGAPGAGKSTAALGLCHLLKRAWVECEYVSEFAKGQVWSGSSHLISKQNWVLANQEFPLTGLAGKVELAVSDSPLPLSAFYAAQNYYPASFSRAVFDLFNRYDNVNFFIRRGAHPYSGKGRLQNEEESDAIAEKMKAFLHANGVDYVEFVAGDHTPQDIFDWLVGKGFALPRAPGVVTLPE